MIAGPHIYVVSNLDAVVFLEDWHVLRVSHSGNTSKPVQVGFDTKHESNSHVITRFPACGLLCAGSRGGKRCFSILTIRRPKGVVNPVRRVSMMGNVARLTIRLTVKYQMGITL